ncbi:MAG: chloride channel protein [Actinomycetota bacterium]
MRNRALRFTVYAAIGVAVGLLVAAFDYVAVEVVLHRVTALDTWQLAIAPGLGLGVTALVLRYIGRGAPTATSEEFINAYHDRHDRLRLSYLPARLLAGVATVGGSGALGLEGPSIYAGGTVGASFQHRLRWLFAGKDGRMLMVAGAAAGVAAIFKTPATGVLFALEVPYKGDVARRALLPALIASATSYLTFVSIIGTTPIFALTRREIETDAGTVIAERVLDFDLGELAAAAILGLVAGLGALLFAKAMLTVKRIEKSVAWWRRWLVASVLLGVLVPVSLRVFDEPLSTGEPDDLLRWVTRSPDSTVALLAALFVVRMVATLATLGGGGVGGVFIPLAIQGVILGGLAGEVLLELDLVEINTATILFPGIGIAAFLGAGYRTPLASVMFVAESTGQASFVVPALIATAVSQVVMGSTSVSAYQRDTRTGHLERRFGLPLRSALIRDVHTVPSRTSIAEFVWDHALVHREVDVPVVDDGRFLGMAHLHDVNDIGREHWSDLAVSEMMHTGGPSARLSWTLRQATEIMEREDLEVLPVVDEAGTFLGVVTADAILRLDEILDETEGGR